MPPPPKKKYMQNFISIALFYNAPPVGFLPNTKLKTFVVGGGKKSGEEPHPEPHVLVVLGTISGNKLLTR